ncbi:MAG: hypothetical protein NVSMB23_01120 [Myxococcales bacterium]
MRRLAASAFALCLAAPAVRASSLTDEVSLGTTSTSPQNPRVGNFTNNLNATFDLSERVTFLAGLALTVEGATAPARGSPFASSPNAVAALSGGLGFDPSDHVSLGIGLDISPPSTQVSASQIVYRDNATGGQVVANDELRTTSSNSALDVSASYDSAGESDLEWGLNLGVTGSHYRSDQRITRLQTERGAVVTTQQVLSNCQASGRCSRALLTALRQQPASLDSLKVSVGGQLTVYRDTDLSFSADYYGYDQDPTTAGYFSIGAAGRTTISGGSGIPIAPLHFVLRPEIAHRWGDFSARVWATAGHYVDQAGQSTRGLGTRIQYKFTKAFRMWASVGGQRDTDETGHRNDSANVALGAGYRF